MNDNYLKTIAYKYKFLLSKRSQNEVLLLSSPQNINITSDAAKLERNIPIDIRVTTC